MLFTKRACVLTIERCQSKQQSKSEKDDNWRQNTPFGQNTV